jgi:DNA excision repair protein ERCC-1
MVKSFSDIAKASSDQLQKLPGFGQVKVRRIKDAFEKPFRSNATSSVTFAASQYLAPASSLYRTPTPVDVSAMKGKETEEKLAPHRRPPSPIWDIELDLNDSPPPP